MIPRIKKKNVSKKRVSYLYRTAQPLTLASFQTWGSSVGAGRIRLTRDKSKDFYLLAKCSPE